MRGAPTYPCTPAGVHGVCRQQSPTPNRTRFRRPRSSSAKISSRLQEQWAAVPSPGSAPWSVINGNYRTRGAGNQISVITWYPGVYPGRPAHANAELRPLHVSGANAQSSARGADEHRSRVSIPGFAELLPGVGVGGAHRDAGARLHGVSTPSPADSLALSKSSGRTSSCNGTVARPH